MLKVSGGVIAGSVNLTGAATTLTVDKHAGRLLRVNNSTGKYTLPAISSSDIGSTYTFVLETDASPGMSILTNGTDKFFGFAEMLVSGVSQEAFHAATDNDVIQMNGGTQGGIGGSKVVITTAGTSYSVEAMLMASGTPVTPFNN